MIEMWLSKIRNKIEKSFGQGSDLAPLLCLHNSDFVETVGCAKRIYIFIHHVIQIIIVS